MGSFFVIATPIGNLQDITLRALKTLKNVDIVFAEDTRVTKKLLYRFSISKPVYAYHEHSSSHVFKNIAKLLHDGKNLALVTDAGTPGLSDPGQRLISYILKSNISANIVPIPGPSALTALISASDIDCSQFVFVGFPPRKKGRKSFFESISRNATPTILYESPHRIKKTILELLRTCEDKYCNIGRELTKIHEEIFRGLLSEANDHFIKERLRGEFIIIIS